jgi:hypothetical protein
LLSQKEDVLLQDNLHVVLDPELEMYREKGILNGQEVAMLRDARSGVLKHYFTQVWLIRGQYLFGRLK